MNSLLKTKSYSTQETICHTATCKIILAHYPGFNGFPEVNWDKKPLKAVEPLSFILPTTMAARACAGERLAGEDPSDGSGLIHGDATDEGAAGFIKGEGVADPKFDRTAGDEVLGDALEVSSGDGMMPDAATTLVIGDEGFESFDEDRNNDLIPVAQPSLVAPLARTNMTDE